MKNMNYKERRKNNNDCLSASSSSIDHQRNSTNSTKRFTITNDCNAAEHWSTPLSPIT